MADKLSQDYAGYFQDNKISKEVRYFMNHTILCI